MLRLFIEPEGSIVTNNKENFMASKKFNFMDVLVRILIALFLVYVTYNPSGISYVHWVKNIGESSVPLVVLVGVILLTGWVIYLRATARSLGALGVFLIVALFGCLIWLAIDFQLLSMASSIFIYLVLLVCAIVLGIGMSWSHVRRRISGQADMDDVGD